MNFAVAREMKGSREDMPKRAYYNKVTRDCMHGFSKGRRVLLTGKGILCRCYFGTCHVATCRVLTDDGSLRLEFFTLRTRPDSAPRKVAAHSFSIGKGEQHGPHKRKKKMKKLFVWCSRLLSQSVCSLLCTDCTRPDLAVRVVVSQLNNQTTPDDCTRPFLWRAAGNADSRHCSRVCGTSASISVRVSSARDGVCLFWNQPRPSSSACRVHSV